MVDPKEHNPSDWKLGTWQEAAVHNAALIFAVQENYKRFARRVWAALIVLSIVAGLITWQIFRLIGDNSQRVSDIQGQRLALCQDQDRRHDQTISKLNFEIARLPNPERTRAEVNKKFTIALIDQLAPSAKCSRVVKPLPKVG